MRVSSNKKILIGFKDDNIVYLDDIFYYGDNSDCMGATGTLLEYKTKSEADSLWEDVENNPENYIDRYFWIEAAKGGYNGSYDEFCEEEIENQKDNLPWPNADSNASFVSLKDEEKIKEYFSEEEELLFSWVGGGRIFGPEYELDECVNPEVFELIKEVESENITKERAKEIINYINNLD